jgi:hypothetical protein
MWRAVIVAAGCALTGCGGSGSTAAPATSTVGGWTAYPGAPLALPVLPSHGFALSRPGGVTLTNAAGRPVARLRGWKLNPSSGLPGTVMLVSAGRSWVLDAAGHRLVIQPAGAGSEPLAGGARLVRGAGHRWAVEGAAVAWNGNGDVTASRDGRLVTSGGLVPSNREAMDITDGTRVPVPRRCVAGARAGGDWYLLCTGPAGPWVAVLHGGRVRVLNPRLGRGWSGSYLGAQLSPDARTLLLQYSGECETPIAFFASATGGAPRPVTGEREWSRAPESYALGWTHDGAALVRIPRPACGWGSGPGVYRISTTGARRRLAGANAVLWGRW